MNPLISVIIPTFNRGNYIRSAVESVLTQTYPYVEVLVIDDGSTDQTGDVIKSIKDSRVKYFFTSNKGNYFARNTGLENAQGEFIAFLDSDDRFLPSKLSMQLERFQQNPELGLCCGNVYIKHLDSPEKFFEDAAHSFSYDFDTNNGFIERAIESNFMVTSTVMIRRSCVKTLGIFDTTYQNAMDYEFFLRVIFNFHAVYMKDKLVERLVHPLGVSQNTINTHKALIFIFSDASRRFEQEKLFSVRHKELIHQAWQKSMYFLGLEYLVGYDFDNAYRCFTESGYQKRYLFKKIAMMVAKFRLSLLVPLICSYRNFRQYDSLHRNPVSVAMKAKSSELG